MLDGFPIPHWQPSHGTETPSALGKGSLNNLFREGLEGEGAYIIDLNYTFPIHLSLE